MSPRTAPIGISPSLLCADLLHLGEQIQIMDEFHPTWYHVDIMDGRFVPNFTFGPDLVKAVKSCSTTPVAVHLMCETPQHHVRMFAEAGADAISFHIETAPTPLRVLNQIHALDKQAGVVINPATPLEFLPFLLEKLDFITVMAIEPGFAGQPYINFTYEKIRCIHDMITASGKRIPIEVDGGITAENGLKSVECGADILVAGYFSVFKRNSNIRDNYLTFLNELEAGI